MKQLMRRRLPVERRRKCMQYKHPLIDRKMIGRVLFRVSERAYFTLIT